jgi:hypothetical protein
LLFRRSEEQEILRAAVDALEAADRKMAGIEYIAEGGFILNSECVIKFDSKQKKAAAA